MYLHQKLNYGVVIINSDEDLEKIAEPIDKKFLYFDTETTGLDIINDKPFLLVFGYDNLIVVGDVKKSNIVEFFINFAKQFEFVFAHNCKYDYHMLLNYFKLDIIEGINFCDSMVIARLTSYCDDDHMSLSLENLGTNFVDKESKFAGHIIKDIIKKEDARKRKEFISSFPNSKEIRGDIKKATDIAVYLDSDEETKKYYDSILEHIKSTNYEDVYNKEPNLMLNYAVDDVVILKEYVQKAFPTLQKIDKNLNTFKRESELILVVADMERQGFYSDLEYLFKCRKEIKEYRKKLYEKLWEITEVKISVGQYNEIKKIVKNLFDITLVKCDEKNLKNIIKINPDKPKLKEMLSTILILRTVDKWLNTYIDGKIKDIKEGKFYATINNQGAVSGRVSSNMQQQPKDGIYDENKLEFLKLVYGDEHSVDFNKHKKEALLFHPRKVVTVPNNDYILCFQDFAQMELRVQAFYTLLVSTGDINMCRAYIPFNCINIETGEAFDHKNLEHVKQWNSGEWVLKEDSTKKWAPTDLHSATTFTAFPFLKNDKNHPEFSKYRKLGKMCNFLKNYQGGIAALQSQLDCSLEIASVLDEAYYKTFPVVKDYQKWVTDCLFKYGYVENLMGRRYYMSDRKNYYKASNYVIQGTCADLVKQKQIEIYKYLKDKKSKLVYPIHDEVMLYVHKEELYVIEEVNRIITDTYDLIPYIPMLSDIEVSETNWADKMDYKKWLEKREKC